MGFYPYHQEKVGAKRCGMSFALIRKGRLRNEVWVRPLGLKDSLLKGMFLT